MFRLTGPAAKSHEVPPRLLRSGLGFRQQGPTPFTPAGRPKLQTQ